MIISLIAAMSNGRVIGKDGLLPWSLPSDMKRFRQLTMGKSIIMGRKTFESIGKGLSGRVNIVLTRDLCYCADGCTVVHSIGKALRIALKHGSTQQEVMVIGGASLFEQFLPRADRIYLTQIHAHFDGDTYFPEFGSDDWRTEKRIDCFHDKDNSHNYSFLTLYRKK